MPYIGNLPAEKYASYDVQHITTSATSSYVLDKNVANENEIRVVLNNIIQQPGSSYAYTASGNTLTLSVATTSSDTLYVVFTGKAVQTVTPPPSSVGLAQFNATGSPGTNTFLRGDNSWATPSDTSLTLNNNAANRVVAGTGTTNTMSAQTNLIYDGTRLGVGANGSSVDLGVGLHIKVSDTGASVNSGSDALVIEDNGGDMGMTLLSSTSGEGRIAFGDSGGNSQGQISYAHNGDSMRFYTAGAEKVRVASDGNVGIGETAPLGKLHVYTADTGATPSSEADEFVIEHGGQIGGMSILADGNSVSKIAFGDSNDNDAGMVSYSHASNKLMFNVSGSERLMMNEYGALTSTTTSTAGHIFYFDYTSGDRPGFTFIDGDINTVGSIYINASANSTSYNTSSDYRLKENIDYDFDATTRLKQLKPARFNFINAENRNLVDGFIAHEVSDIVPEAISGAKDAMHPEVLYTDKDELPEGKNIGDVKEAIKINPQQIDQSKLVPLLVKTIQELEARITTLENA